MTQILQAAETALNTVETWLDKFVTSLTQTLITDKNQIRQSTLQEHQALVRMQKRLKDIKSTYDTKVKKNEKKILHLIREENLEIAPGILDALAKESTRTSPKYKDILASYTPLLNIVFNAHGYSPEKFHTTITALIKMKPPVDEAVAATIPSVSYKLEIR